MAWHSILYKSYDSTLLPESYPQPDFFADLNLDLVVNSIIMGKEEYNLTPFFYYPLKDLDGILYRQEVMQDLENVFLLEKISEFAEKMRTVRKLLTSTAKLYYKFHRQRWFLDVVKIYCESAKQLRNDLSDDQIKSQGLISFREYLDKYVHSDSFIKLFDETKRLIEDLSSVKYCVLYCDLRVQVRSFKSEYDYSEQIESAFSKFRYDPVKDYRVEYPANSMAMNHIEAQILDGVAKLYPDIFSRLDSFSELNQDFSDEAIKVFDREIQFYIAYLDYIRILKKEGLSFCYPKVTTESKEIYNYEGYDLALAYKLINEKSSVVANDFYLRDKERIIVVSGPNQGGKTTFARMFGQLHYLTSLGCPVPGIRAQMFLFDKLLTHFEKEENIQNLRGKLQDDLVRIHRILEEATTASIIILNEVFTSTTFQDQLFLSRNIMQKIIKLDLLCVWVTFIDELAFSSDKNVSMISTVVPDNPSVRTFKIIRGPADGLAYAMSIAEKYKVNYEFLRERLKL